MITRYLIAVFLAAATGWAEDASREGLLRLLREPLPAGMHADGAPVFYAANLYEYIDGGAELFHSYELQALLHQEFKATGADLTVDIYDMGTAENASAIFADTRVPKPRPVAACDGALGHDYGLQLRRGATYGEITVPTADPTLQAAAEAFAKAVCGK